MAISESYQRQKVRGGVLSLPSEGRLGYINLDPCRLFVQQPPKRKRDREGHSNYYASAYN